MQKIKGILALIENGATDGERQAARAALQRMMAKYKLTNADLGLETNIVKFDYQNEHEKKLLVQIIATVLNAPSVDCWFYSPYSNNRRASKSIWVQVTRVQEMEITDLYNAYRKDMRAWMGVLVEAFIMANNIYPKGAKGKSRLSKKEIERQKSIVEMSGYINTVQTK